MTVSATNLTDDIASALTINGENILESATTLPISYVSGTFDHINELTSEAPTLTIKANTLGWSILGQLLTQQWIRSNSSISSKIICFTGKQPQKDGADKLTPSFLHKMEG